jgi:hypothetical protein
VKFYLGPPVGVLSPSVFTQKYERLLAVKRKYDPEEVLYVKTGVGSEGWEENAEGRLCRV